MAESACPYSIDLPVKYKGTRGFIAVLFQSTEKQIDPQNHVLCPGPVSFIYTDILSSGNLRKNAHKTVTTTLVDRGTQPLLHGACGQRPMHQ